MIQNSSLALSLTRDMIPCKPFVKWAGGKRQLLEQLTKRLPKNFGLGSYFEPFIGGGALFFHLQPKSSYLSDINSELVNTYRVIQKNVDSLIEELKKLNNTEEEFYRIRGIDRTKEYESWSEIKRAARFVFLNKTAFNGLWRVNSKGQHNVPFGKYLNPNICDEPNLKACSSALQSCIIEVANFYDIEEKVNAGDFVYFDPPYHPLTKTSNFTSYTKGGFYAEDQIKLKELIDRLSSKKALVMLSNSSAKLIIDLYCDKYNLEYVDASRAINCNANGRGPVKEVIITNYQY